MERILLAYSGSDAATAALRRLAGKARTEVCTVTLDLGRTRDVSDIRVRALDAGAVRAHVVDGRERLAADYLLPAIRGGAFRSAAGPSLKSVCAPIVARTLVETAAIEDVATVAHTSADDRTSTRIEHLIASLAPNLRVLRGRVPSPVTGHPAAAEGPARPRVGAATPAVVEIAFDEGLPLRVNDVALSPGELVESLGLIGQHHGVAGDVAAIAILAAAHGTLGPTRDDPNDPAAQAAREYADVIDEGRWFTPQREGLDACAIAAHRGKHVTVRVRLADGMGDIDLAPPARPARLENAQLVGRS